jgi:hypothetical protein
MPNKLVIKIIIKKTLEKGEHNINDDGTLSHFPN